MAKYDARCDNKKCKQFGLVFEINKKMSEDMPNCDVCKEKLTNVIVPPTVTFSGSGWYGKSRNN